MLHNYGFADCNPNLYSHGSWPCAGKGLNHCLMKTKSSCPKLPYLSLQLAPSPTWPNALVLTLPLLLALLQSTTPTHLQFIGKLLNMYSDTCKAQRTMKWCTSQIHLLGRRSSSPTLMPIMCMQDTGRSTGGYVVVKIWDWCSQLVIQAPTVVCPLLNWSWVHGRSWSRQRAQMDEKRKTPDEHIQCAISKGINIGVGCL